MNEAINAIPETGKTDWVYVKGIVSAFYDNIDFVQDDYHRYYISDDGHPYGLLVYKGNGLNNTPFVSENDLLIGDEVVVFGQLTQKSADYTIAEGNYIVSRKTIPSISLSTTTINAKAEGEDGTIYVVYNSMSNTDGEAICCDANGEPAYYDWLSAWINTDGNLRYSIVANKGVERTAYIKVRANDDDNNMVCSKLITITQAEAFVDTEKGFVKITSTEELETGDYLIVNEDGGVAFNGGLATLDVAKNTIPVDIRQNKINATDEIMAAQFFIMPSTGTISSASDYYIGASVYDNGLASSETNDFDKNVFSFDENGNAVISFPIDGNNLTLRYNSASDQQRFRYYKSGQQPIQLYRLYHYTFHVTDAGWASYIAEDNVSFTDDVKAYIVTGNTNTSVALREVKAVLKRTPVIVNAKPGNYGLNVVHESLCENVNDNKLQVYYGSGQLSGTWRPFVLAKDGDSACFKQWTGNPDDLNGRVMLPLELDLTAGSGARSLKIVFEDNLAGIETVGNAVATSDNGAYTLSGQRVQKPTKGLYIIGGKKVVVK